LHIDDAWLGRQHALDRNLIGLLNLLAGQQLRQRRNIPGRWPPGHAYNGHALLFQGLSKEFRPNGERGHWLVALTYMVHGWFAF
jgi:hypothetical protein